MRGAEPGTDGTSLGPQGVKQAMGDTDIYEIKLRLKYTTG